MELIISLVFMDLQQIPIIQDLSFWHLIGVAACTLLGRMLNKHLEKTEKTLERITEILNQVVAKNEVQEVKIDQHERRLEKLENG